MSKPVPLLHVQSIRQALVFHLDAHAIRAIQVPLRKVSNHLFTMEVVLLLHVPMDLAEFLCQQVATGWLATVAASHLLPMPRCTTLGQVSTVLHALPTPLVTVLSMAAKLMLATKAQSAPLRLHLTTWGTFRLSHVLRILTERICRRVAHAMLDMLETSLPLLTRLIIPEPALL